MKVREIDIPGYRELVAAGIMESDGEDFRLTAEGRSDGENIVEREQERIERGRYAPPDVSRLSDRGWGLLHRIASGERGRGHARNPAPAPRPGRGPDCPGHQHVRRRPRIRMAMDLLGMEAKAGVGGNRLREGGRVIGCEGIRGWLHPVPCTRFRRGPEKGCSGRLGSSAPSSRPRPIDPSRLFTDRQLRLRSRLDRRRMIPVADATPHIRGKSPRRFGRVATGPFAQSLPPLWPLSRSGFSTPESTPHLSCSLHPGDHED